MAEKDSPPKYEDEQVKTPTETSPIEPSPTKSVVVTLTQRKPGRVAAKPTGGSTMGISLTDKDVLRQRNDAISIPTTISKPELVVLLWKRAQAHWGADIVPDIKTLVSNTDSGGSAGFIILAIEHAGKRVIIVDQAGWDAAKGWLFEGTGSLLLDFAMSPAVLKKEPVANDSSKKGKGKRCVVQ